jgi:hypothetical protein
MEVLLMHRRVAAVAAQGLLVKYSVLMGLRDMVVMAVVALHLQFQGL